LSQHYDIFNPAFDEILQQVNDACSKLNIDFYIAGAVARDYHLNKIDDYSPSRKTADIDIAVMVADEETYIKLKESLIASKKFIQHKEPIKLLFNNAIELDLLPFGDIENEGVTQLTKQTNFVLGVEGFGLLNNFTEKTPWNNKVEVRICSLEGIILLKLIANDERPQRTKDLADIQSIIKLYFDVESDVIYSENYDLLELYDVEDIKGYKSSICAHVIGRKLKTILKKDEKLNQRIITILKKDKGEFWNNILTGLTE
jgi:predicted nucleotidyltransferase